MSQAEQDKPKYGQYQQPEYGAMSGQYGPNYNPYIYGAPEPDTKKDSAAAAGDNGGAAQSQQAGQPYGQQPAWPGNQQAGAGRTLKAANSPVRAHIRAGTRACRASSMVNSRTVSLTSRIITTAST